MREPRRGVIRDEIIEARFIPRCTDTVVAVNASLQSFTRRANSSTVVGAVIGVVVNGAVVTLQVPDVSASALYTVRIVEVADRENVLRPSLTGYGLTVSR